MHNIHMVSHWYHWGVDLAWSHSAVLWVRPKGRDLAWEEGKKVEGEGGWGWGGGRVEWMLHVLTPCSLSRFMQQSCVFQAHIKSRKISTLIPSSGTPICAWGSRRRRRREAQRSRDHGDQGDHVHSGLISHGHRGAWWNHRPAGQLHAQQRRLTQLVYGQDNWLLYKEKRISSR